MLGLLFAVPLLAYAADDAVTVSARWAAPPQPGAEAQLAFDFKVRPGFWFYGEKRGAVSKPTKIAVTAPAGYVVGKPRFPAPKEKEIADGTQYIYDQDTTVVVPVTLPAGAKPGDAAAVQWKIDFQFCDKNSCFIPYPLPKGTLAFFPGAAPTNVTPINVPPTPIDPPPVAGKLPDYQFVGVDGEVEAPASLPWMLFAAFLGGVILNVMPCVLPVIAIKALSFVQHAGESRARLLALNVAYTAGVLAVFAALATLAVVAQRGWGSHFQSPYFTLAMACLIFALALSLLGVYEIPLPGFVGAAAGATHGKEGLTGSFLGGAMTTVLATPCTGPFVGTVLAWSAQQKSTPLVYAVWLTIGVGMASPYLLTAFFPGLLKLLPKPGPWMETFKQLSGFVLLATVVFLLGLGGRNPLPALTLLVGLGFALWWIGKYNNILTADAVRWRNRGIAGLAVAAAAGVYWLQVSPRKDILPWEPFTVAALAEAQRAGKPVLIDFTADWCVNCKSNFYGAIDTPTVLAEVQRRGIVCLLADKTSDRPEIDATLTAWRGSTDIPVTAILAPAPMDRKPRGVLLTALFSEARLLKAIDAALGPAPKP